MEKMGQFFLLFLHLFAFSAFGKDLKVFKRGKIELVDETELAQPKDYSLDFEEDLRKVAEFGDIYDQQLPPLPRFELHKNGKNMGWTKLPIVTRKKSSWNTPLPKNRGVENEPWPYTTTKKPALKNQRPTTTSTPPPHKMEEKPAVQIQTLPPPSQETTTKTSKKPTKMPTTQATTPRAILATSKASLVVPSTSTTKDTFPLLETSTIPVQIPPIKPSSFQKPSFGQNEQQTNALERLRKKLLTLRPGAPQHTEVSVKSNSFTIRPSPPAGDKGHRQFPQQPSILGGGGPIPNENGGRFYWSRSWHIGPDGRMEIRTWDSNHGEGIEQRQLSSLKRRKWLGGTIPTPPSPHPPLESGSKSLSSNKPPLIQSQAHPHFWPIFDCRMLNTAIDGQPSATNDPTCPLDFPGIPSDGSCKCTYQASARDDQGCATGFIYTCAKKTTIFAENEDKPFMGAKQLQ